MKIGIRTKISFLISLAVAIVLVFGLGFSYFWGFVLLRDSIADKLNNVALTLASSISNMITNEIEELILNSYSSFWRKNIQNSNLKYASMDAPSMNIYFSERDKKWSQEPAGSSIFQEYLENEASVRLKELMTGQKEIAEIFITDEFGGLVGSSGKTSDFYQADEAWWQKAFNGGKGKVYVGDVEYDESSAKWSIAIAVPIKDDAGKVIGVCKSVIDIDKIFNPLENFKMGKSGHAILIDELGNVLFHPGVAAMSRRLKDFVPSPEALKINKNGLLFFSDFHKTKIFLSQPMIIKNPYLEERSAFWRIMVSQDYSEVFAPFKNLIRQSVALAVILLFTILPVSFIFGSVFAKPLEKLHEATKKIGAGNLDYQVSLRTGDEIEDLAVSFNQMTEELRRTMVCRDTLATEIDERKKMEEQQNLLMKDLEETNRIMVGRELRMVELKKEVNELSKEAGRPAPYDILS